MKISKRYLFGLLICMLLVGSVAFPAQAKAVTPDPIVTSDPQVVALTGDMTFSVALLDKEKMPGSEIKNDSSLPIGYSDTLQFNGQGIEISGVSGGSEKACFNFNDYNFGWTGNVYYWNGTKWEKVDTTISSNGDGITTACAVVYGNGVYAFLEGYTNPPSKSKKSAGSGASCPTVSVDSFSTAKGGIDYAVTFTFSPKVTYVEWGATDWGGNVHLASGSTAVFSISSGRFGVDSTTNTSPHTEDEAIRFDLARDHTGIIASGSTIDLNIYYKVGSSSTTISCTATGVALPPATVSAG